MIEFQFPTAFLLFPPVLLALFLFTSRSKSPLSKGRNRISLLLRSILSGLLISALAGPSLSQETNPPSTTIFLLDISDSVSKASLEKAIAHIESESEKNRSALIIFGGRAELVRAPSPERITVSNTLLQQTYEGEARVRRERLIPSQTNYASAIRLAQTLGIPRPELILLSDGQDPLGTFPPEWKGKLELVRPSEIPPDIAVLGTRNPIAIRTGEPFDIRVDMRSSANLKAQITLQLGKQRWTQEQVTLPTGSSSVIFRNLLPDAPSGSHTLRVFAQAAGDREARNNYWTTPLIIVGRPRVLLWTKKGPSSHPVAQMLRAHQFDVHEVSPDRMDGIPLQRYSAVLSVELRAASFSPKTIETLKRYVENGGGFWMIAPPEPGAGPEFANSALSPLLPVEFDSMISDGDKPEKPDTKVVNKPLKEKRESPTVALLLVIDKSGSMAGQKLELVKEACRVTGDTLSARDSIGVLAFDARPHWVLEFTSPARKEHIRDRIYRLLADGGTDIYPALEAAHLAMKQHPRAQKAGIRHVILFSDGDTRAADFRSRVNAMVKDGITISTVCILRGKFDPILMNNIAHLGKGRFASTGSFSQIPKIFTEEARTLLEDRRPEPKRVPAKPKPVEKETLPGKIQPVILAGHQVLWRKRPEKLPSLSGILRGKAKTNARTPIGTEEGYPLLSFGRIGLGKVAIWTSDLSGKWSSGWIRWTPSGPELFAQIVRHLSDAGGDLDFAGRVTLLRGPIGDSIQVSPGTTSERISLLQLEPSRKNISLHVAQNGTLRGLLERERVPGNYRLIKTEGENSESLLFTTMPPYEAEFELPPPKTSILPGKLNPPARGRKQKNSLLVWFLLAAALMLPLETTLRRWR